jgi:hypothetical protein
MSKRIKIWMILLACLNAVGVVRNWEHASAVLVHGVVIGALIAAIAMSGKGEA